MQATDLEQKIPGNFYYKGEKFFIYEILENNQAYAALDSEGNATEISFTEIKLITPHKSLYNHQEIIQILVEEAYPSNPYEHANLEDILETFERKLTECLPTTSSARGIYIFLTKRLKDGSRKTSYMALTDNMYSEGLVSSKHGYKFSSRANAISYFGANVPLDVSVITDDYQKQNRAALATLKHKLALGYKIFLVSLTTDTEIIKMNYDDLELSIEP